VHKVFDARSGAEKSAGATEILTYSDYAPYSWFEITVRNKTSGEVYLKDGFGRAKAMVFTPTPPHHSETGQPACGVTREQYHSVYGYLGKTLWEY